ncbi:hypothetical protein BD769DRAFT_1541390 [Suillus cothurnatus]|nr:hypothetical protein BD769DRAFT_1541390 [Suillus cothurnatus]
MRVTLLIAGSGFHFLFTFLPINSLWVSLLYGSHSADGRPSFFSLFLPFFAFIIILYLQISHLSVILL